MTSGLRTTSDQSFEKIEGLLANTFALSARLPDLVFRRPMQPSRFYEFDDIASSDFWPTLRLLARANGDTAVVASVLEPKPHYYRREYGTYAAFSLSCMATDFDYWSVLSEGSDTDVTGAIAFSAEVIAFTGRSGGWGCWAERSYGVGIVQSTEPLPADVRTWCATGQALAHFVAPNFRDGVPEYFSSELARNYV